MRIIIFSLVFISIALIIYMLVPGLLEKYQAKQKLKLDKVLVDLPDKEVERKKFAKIYIVFPIIFAVAGVAMLKSALGLGGFIAGAILANIVIKAKLAARRSKFTQQLVDTISLLSGSLKAGLSLQQAIEGVAEEMPEPTKSEFGRIVKESRMGTSLEKSLNSLKKRMHSEELILMITAIMVSRETGGDLTVTFSSLVTTIRERDKLQRRVQVLCTQGKLQGWIMGALPIVFGIFIYQINPTNFDIMLNDQVGRMLLMWAVVSEILGIFFIMKMSKVEI